MIAIDSASGGSGIIKDLISWPLCATRGARFSVLPPPEMERISRQLVSLLMVSETANGDVRCVGGVDNDWVGK